MSARYLPGQILLAALAALVFSDQAGTKNRPILVVRDGGDDDLLVAPITSHAGRSTHHVFLTDWQQAGLRLASVARLEKVATIAKRTVVRPLGQISSNDRNQVKPALQRLFNDILSDW